MQDWGPVLLLRAQARVVRGEIWAATALVMLLGTLVTLTYRIPQPANASPTTEATPEMLFVLVAPLVAAIGMSFLYGSESDPALELEQSTPTTQRQILLARMTLVFGFNLAAGLLGSAVLAVSPAGVEAGLRFWPLVSMWLAPMSFLSMFAFLLTILFHDPMVGALFSLGLWAFQSLHQFGFRLPYPNLLTDAARPLLWILAFGFGAAALWAVERDERWAAGNQHHA